MSIYDYIVIGAYLAFMLALGPVYKSFSKTASDFFRGGGGMLWWVVGSSAFMNSFSAWSFTGGAAKAYRTGTFLLILFACNTVATLVCLVFTAHRFRQLRVITAVEAIRDRYGNSSEQIFNWLPLVFNILFGGIMLYTISVFMSGVFGAKMYQIILILGAVMVIMTLLGGSWAATAGDFVQMLVVLTITVIMAVLALNHEAIGGIGGLIEKMPKGHLDWSEFERPGITWIYAITLVINQTVFANSMQSGGARYLFVKDGAEARKSAWVSVIGFLVLPIIWIIPAFASSIIFPDLAAVFPKLNNPAEGAYVAIATKLLPPGLLGLLVCGIFAASLTSMNSLLNVFSAGFVRNFYIRVIDKNASEGRQILVGRIFILVYGLIWMGIAMLLAQNSEIKLFELILIASASIGLPAALPMLYGMFVKKVPAWSGWSTMVVGFIVSLVIYLGFKYGGFADALRYGWDPSAPLNDIEFGDLKLGLTTAAIFSACTIWFFLTGIFYKYSSMDYRKQVDRFFEVMNTPIDRSQEHEPDYEGDSRQYLVLANLCLAYGGMVLLLLLVPNEWKARLLVLICGGSVMLVGAVLRFIGKRAGADGARSSEGGCDE